jgi:hypothetical protein
MECRGQRTSYQDRLQVGERAAAGESDAQIAKALGYSVWTVRKWRRAHQRAGRVGLVSHMGRPAKGELSQYPIAMCDRIEQLRRDHPGWGATTILDHLGQQEPEFVHMLPSRARVAAFLRAKELTHCHEEHGGVVQLPPQRATQAHEEWEMDAQGAQLVSGVGQVSVINISDVVSRVKVESYPALGTHLGWLAYQLALRRGFMQYGLPVRISLDHDSALYDNTSQSPFPSRLHLWLVALGVEVVFITKPPPAAHAIIERTHQTMSKQAIEGQQWESQAALWYGLDERREVVNERLPCRSLHDQSPLVALPEAVHSQRHYRIEWEEEMLDLGRVHTLLATGRWFRQSNCHGEFWLGMQRYNVGRSRSKSTIEITFDPAALEFVALNERDDETKRFKVLGLTKADLMGDLTTTSLPNYQLSLPFTRDGWCKMQLAALSTGTTL